MINACELLVDYDNLIQDSITIDLAASALFRALSRSGKTIAPAIDLRVRCYGGWYSGASLSDSRIKATSTINASWPSILRSGTSIARLLYSFADTLSHDRFAAGLTRAGATPITHTVVARTGRPRIRKTATLISCPVPSCSAKAIFKALSNGKACPDTACPNTFAACYQPLEQKQVDVHMTVDMLDYVHTSTPDTALAIFSSDNDLAPAIYRAGQLRAPDVTLCLIRAQGVSCYMDVELSRLGVIIEPC